MTQLALEELEEGILPRSNGLWSPGQDSLARRDRHVAVCQAARTGVFGRRRPACPSEAQSQSSRRSSPICLMALTGGTQSEPGDQKRPAKNWSLTSLEVR